MALRALAATGRAASAGEGGKEGLFEYVRPAWQERWQPGEGKTEAEADRNWGAHTPGRPGASKGVRVIGNGDGLIDRTAKLFIGGKQVRPDGEYSYAVLDPKGRLVGYAGDSNRKDVRNAVEAAHRAKGWADRTPHNRAQILYYIAENLAARAGDFADRLRAMTGQSKQAASTEVELSLSRLFAYAGYADKFGGTVQETTLYGLVVSMTEPVGVIGIACPDEYPLLGFVSLLAPAIARGNTTVIVPSGPYPLAATDFYQVLETSDLPGGVVNILTGNRDHLMKTLAARRRQCYLVLWRCQGQPTGRGAVGNQHEAHLGQLRQDARLDEPGAGYGARVPAPRDRGEEHLGADGGIKEESRAFRRIG